MSFPEPFSGRGRRCDPDQEGKRQVPLYLDNAAFSRLIKLGQKAGHTPSRMAQALFDEAIEARSNGKGVYGSPADRLKPGEALADELAERLRQQLAESGRETARANIEAEEERQAHAATKAALADERAQAEGRFSGLLLDLSKVQRERDELRSELERARADLVRSVGEAVDMAAIAAEALELPKVAVEPGPGVDVAPLVEATIASAPILTPPAIGKGTVKAVLAMRGMGATAAEIAKDLALLRPIVDQVLRENAA